MLRYEQLLLENKAWAQEIKDADPAFFERMAQSQNPDILWIGCSDSRVAPDDLTRARPGEIFTHRNIANLVVHTDLNMFSVVQYAVEVLKVTDIVVCGHYGCGGIKAALGNETYGTLDKWLRHIKDVYRIHKDEINAQPDEESRVNRLVELNVQEQLHHLASKSLIQRSWKENKSPYLHGWVFDMKEGIIKPILEVGPDSQNVDPIYRYNV